MTEIQAMISSDDIELLIHRLEEQGTALVLETARSVLPEVMTKTQMWWEVPPTLHLHASRSSAEEQERGRRYETYRPLFDAIWERLVEDPRTEDLFALRDLIPRGHVWFGLAA